jgi:hypothetical protein
METEQTNENQETENFLYNEETPANQDNKSKEDEKAPTVDMVKALQDQILEQNKTLLKESQSKREIADKYAKMANFLENKGVAKYNRETGDFSPIQNDEEQDITQTIKEQIETEENSLLRRLRKKEIDQDEYLEERNEIINPLKSKLIKIQEDQKMNRRVQDLEKQVKQKNEAPRTENQDNILKYQQLAAKHPDSEDQNSALYKKMNEIYANSKIYEDASFNGGKGNALLYEDLIKRAQLELKIEGAQTNSEKESIRNQYGAPASLPYTPKNNTHINKDQLFMIQNMGVKDKESIREINEAYGNYEKTGKLVCG